MTLRWKLTDPDQTSCSAQISIGSGHVQTLPTQMVTLIDSDE